MQIAMSYFFDTYKKKKKKKNFVIDILKSAYKEGVLALKVLSKI